MNADQNRTGSASARLHASQEVVPGGLVAAQLDSSTLLPDPAEPTTMVSRLAAPEVSRSCSAGLTIRVFGSVVRRNFVSAKPRARYGVVPFPRPSAETLVLYSSYIR
jgi:hypothetical protein